MTVRLYSISLTYIPDDCITEFNLNNVYMMTEGLDSISLTYIPNDCMTEFSLINLYT